MFVTLVFGLFGLIPAAIKAGRAETLGLPTAPYWKAFWVTMLLPVAFWIIVLVAASS